MDKEHIILTVGSQGHTGFIVSVETITRRGIFQFDIIGLANKTISESKQRILSAISFSLQEKGHYINKKITTLLSPADYKKEGSHFDLPIAISYLISVKKLFKEKSNSNTSDTNRETSNTDTITNLLSEVVILGELTLTGSVLPIKQIALLIRTAVNRGIKYFILPEGNKSDLTNFRDIHVWPVKHISEIINSLSKSDGSDKNYNINYSTIDNESKKLDDLNHKKNKFLIDSIEGNIQAKRALEIALAGKHHLLLIGTPGSGKSLLARASRELIPKTNIENQNIFQTQIRDRGLLSNSETDTENNIHFREPHHTSSYSEVIGNRLIPGEIVLAHGGILFLDELAEFNRRVLEGLRQPMENKYIQKNYLDSDTFGEPGANNTLIPTDFILIGCMNPCDCGYCFNSNQKKCIYTQGQIDKYRRKMNSPLFQRFDMCIYVAGERGHGDTYKNQDQKLLGKIIKANIERVRNIQENEKTQNIQNTQNTQKIQNTESNLRLNLEGETQNLFEEMCTKNKFSKREENSLIRVARTIADLERCENIKKEHLLEALSYKRKQIG